MISDVVSIKRQFTLDDGSRCELQNFDGGDLDNVHALEVRANPYPWSRQNFIDSVSNSHICVGVKVAGDWCAIAVFSIASGDAELLIISVDPAWQGKGLATQLLQLMAEQLEDYAAELFLEVRASNDRAIELYNRAGFNQLGVRPSYYPAKNGREDAHIYGKTLRIG